MVYSTESYEHKATGFSGLCVYCILRNNLTKMLRLYVILDVHEFLSLVKLKVVSFLGLT